MYYAYSHDGADVPRPLLKSQPDQTVRRSDQRCRTRPEARSGTRSTRPNPKSGTSPFSAPVHERSEQASQPHWPTLTATDAERDEFPCSPQAGAAPVHQKNTATQLTRAAVLDIMPRSKTIRQPQPPRMERTRNQSPAHAQHGQAPSRRPRSAPDRQSRRP